MNTPNTLSTRAELLILAMAKRACQKADIQGYSKIDNDCYLYSREFINTECIKTQGDSKYILLIDGTMLGINNCTSKTLLNVIKNCIQGVANHIQTRYNLVVQNSKTKQTKR